MGIKNIRYDFEFLKTGVVYADSACVALKPKQVVDAMCKYYNEFPACAGRSMHKVANKTTEAVRQARKEIATFFGAKSDEIIFTRNTTEGINLIANSLELKKGDKVLTSDKEHNSNLLPWQKLVTEKGIIHEIVFSNEDNTFNLEEFKEKVQGVKLVSLVHTSNLDGITNPIKEITRIAHKAGALVMIDAAQSAPHKELNVTKLDVDFMACSGHKMMGPSGMGIIFGKSKLLEKLNTFLVGGETVYDSTYEDAKYEKAPEKFEAGLQNYAGILGFAEACKYLKKLGLKNIEKHEKKLGVRLAKGLSEIEGFIPISSASQDVKGGVVSFNIKGLDPHQIALMLDSAANIACRSGAHCVHSWFNAHGMEGSLRFSLYAYNTEEEVDYIIKKIKEVVEILRK